jgi:hypothetical protein
VASGAWHHSTLQGRDGYIVEGEALVAMLLDDLLQVFGCQVVEIASRVETAHKSITERIFAVAILSVNLKGETKLSGSECARAPWNAISVCNRLWNTGDP